MRSYAGFWRRLLAHLIDVLIVAALLAASGALGLVAMSVETGDGSVNINFGGNVSTFISVAYVIGFWATLQATPGKLVVGARIVDARTGGRPGLGQLVGRFLAHFVSSFFAFLGFLWIAFDARKQGWHDKLAGTAVVRAPWGKSARLAAETSESA